MLDRPKVIWLALTIVSASAAQYWFVRPAEAQEVSQFPIRVESKQVLVPVSVLDRQRYNEIRVVDPSDLQDESRVESLIAKAQDVPIRGLSAKDFRLFEDGREQAIQNVAFPAATLDRARDNVGQHYEFIGSGGGRWIYPEIPLDGKIHIVVPFPRYVLAYAPPPAPPGSCHKVQVKIRSHPDAMIFSLTTYCRTELSASDPLRDTKFGQQMEPDLTAEQSGRIPVFLAAAVLFGPGTQGQMHLVLEFPPKALRFQPDINLVETIGTLGRVTTVAGYEAARFSDFACCQNRHGMDFGGERIDSLNSWADKDEAPRGYETDVPLETGAYRLCVVLSDGSESNLGGKRRGSDFGRAEVSIEVPVRDPQHIALSDIALAKRFRPALQPPEDSTFKSPNVYVPLVSKGVEYSPTADTTFKTTDAFLFFLQVYDPLISTVPACTQSAPAWQAPQPINSSAEASAASGASAHTPTTTPTTAANGVAVSIPSQCLPQAQINLRIVDAKTGAVMRNLAPVNAAEFAIPGNPIIPIGSGIHIGDLPPGQYRLEAQATTLPAALTSGSISLSTPPPPPQVTPWHSVSFSVQ